MGHIYLIVILGLQTRTHDLWRKTREGRNGVIPLQQNSKGDSFVETGPTKSIRSNNNSHFKNITSRKSEYLLKPKGDKNYNGACKVDKAIAEKLNELTFTKQELRKFFKPQRTQWKACLRLKCCINTLQNK